MALVFMLLAGLAVWQQHFIWGGIQSNPYLNAIIIGGVRVRHGPGLTLAHGPSQRREGVLGPQGRV